jgi:hypothetical protein
VTGCFLRRIQVVELISFEVRLEIMVKFYIYGNLLHDIAIYVYFTLTYINLYILMAKLKSHLSFESFTRFSSWYTASVVGLCDSLYVHCHVQL